MTAFVLIHGAYQGAWIWKAVVDRLRAAGHEVHVPTLDGCGERRSQLRPGIDTESQGEEIAELLFFHDLRDAVLVGTSSGGMVMAAAAERARERIARLVFADALAMFDGEAVSDILDPPAAIRTDLGMAPSREDALGRMFAELTPEMAAWAADRLTLQPILTFTQAVKLPTFWSQSWDASVVHCPRARNPGKPHQKRCADALGARWHEIDTGHYPMLSTPDELVRIILEG